MTSLTAGPTERSEHVRVAVIGSGFADVVLERAAELGGTWRDNTYPGCRCDVPSHLYSFSFAPNPTWSETYSPQAEIQAYLRRTAEEFGVTQRIRFRHDMHRAAWDAGQSRWEHDLVLTRDHVVACAPGVRAGWFAAMTAMDLVDGITSVAVPTTVVIGSRDTLTPPPASDTIVTTIPGATLQTLPDYGHMLPLEAPDIVADTIRSHVRPVADG
jgi:pimeloyl-ACP methyl ester carboxylesterase